MTKMDSVLQRIEELRGIAKARRDGNVRECGRQLADILRRLNSEDQAEIVMQDFAAGRDIFGAEKKIAEAFRKNGGIEGEEAEEIICSYFGIMRPAAEAAPAQAPAEKPEKPKKAKLDIDLADFF